MRERASADGGGGFSPRGGGRARTVRLACVVAGVVGLAACHSPPPRSAPDTTADVRGCWELEVTAEGAQLDSLRTWLPDGTLPPVLELDTVPAADGDADGTTYAAYSWFDGRRETAPFSAWQPIEGDSIRVQRTGALSGTMLRLTGSRDGLVGIVVGFTDVRPRGDLSGGTGRRQGPVAASRVACPGREAGFAEP